jgi:hypothetical protein
MKNVNSGIFKVLYKCFLIFFLLFLFGAEFRAQKSRTLSMGGLTFSIVDKDESFDPFEMGNNPAWLINNEKDPRLDITPSLNNSWGNYREKYSPEGTANYNIGFIGVKPLGNAGTFRGSAVYDYELRRKNYRTLKKDTYAGEAFFFTDTTAGDFRYNGPTFEFMHSLELFDNLFIGASVDYQISDGLKKIYTYAQTLFRNVSGNIGVAYKLSENFSAGVNYYLFDSQERIEASDVNLFTVRTFHYRGDTYAVELRGSSQNYKLKKKGNKFSGQLYLNTDSDIEIGLTGGYKSSNTSVNFPVSNIIDNEDGYANFDEFLFQLKGRYGISKRATIGISSGYLKNKSWSKNTLRNLLLWEWEYTDMNAGVGASYFLLPETFLIGLEYEIHFVQSDSSKYVDNKSSSLESLDHLIKLGMEYKISEEFFIRAGYNFTALVHDFIIGGNDIQINLYTVGCGIRFSDSFVADGRLEYLDTSLTNNKNLGKSKVGGFITLRFFSF